MEWQSSIIVEKVLSLFTLVRSDTALPTVPWKKYVFSELHETLNPFSTVTVEHNCLLTAILVSIMVFFSIVVHIALIALQSYVAFSICCLTLFTKRIDL